MEQNSPEYDFQYPFRAGWPKLPCLPLEYAFVDQKAATPSFKASIGAIVGVLDDLGIHSREASLVYRFHPGRFQDKHLTVFLRSNIDDGPGIEVWRRAVWRIRQELSSRGIDIDIELIDRQSDNQIFSSPILSNETELLQAWRSCSLGIIEAMASHKWKTIDLVHRHYRGVPNPDIKATIIISAEDTDTWWESTLPAIRKRVPPFFSIELLDLRGVSLYATNSIEAYYDPYFTNRHSLYFESIQMGASFGVKGQQWSGAIGGVIRLEGKGTFAITNHHLVGHDNPRPITSTDKVVAVCPSDDDHEKLQIYDSARIEYEMEKLRKMGVLEEDLDLALTGPYDGSQQEIPQLTFANMDMAMFDLNRSQKRLGKQVRLDVVNPFRRYLAKSDQVDRSFGTVFASSGRKAAQYYECDEEDLPPELRGRIRWASDWALIESDGRRNIKETVDHCFHRELKLDHGDATAVYQNIELGKNYNVAKKGNTTRWTLGTINAAESFHNYDSARKAARGGSEVVISHSIISRARNERREIVPFCEDTELGSLVLLDEDKSTYGGPGSNREGSGKAPMVGLLFGRNFGSGCSYMTPMGVLIKDIQDVTDMDVIQPKYDGVAAARPDSNASY